MEKQRQSLMVFGTSLQILQEKLKCFEQKQREELIVVNEIGMGIHFIPQIPVYPSKISDQTQLINFRFQLLYNRIKRLMDTQTLMFQKLILDNSKNRSGYQLMKYKQMNISNSNSLSNSDRSIRSDKADNYEIYQLLNEAKQENKTLQNLNIKANNKIKELQQQINQLINKQQSLQNTFTKHKQRISKLQTQQHYWTVQKQHLLQNISQYKQKIQHNQNNMDKYKQKLIRSCVQKQNLEQQIVNLNYKIKEGEQKIVELDKSILIKIQQMKQQLRKDLREHIQNLDTKETVSFKLFKKMVHSVNE